MESAPLLSPNPTSPPRRPDWLRESCPPTPRLNIDFDGEFGDEVLKAIWEVPSNLVSVAEEDEEDEGAFEEPQRADEHERPMSPGISPSESPEPLPHQAAYNRQHEPADAVSISSCSAHSTPPRSPAIPNTPLASGHAPAGSHNCIPDQPAARQSRHYDKRYTFGPPPAPNTDPSPRLMSATPRSISRAGAIRVTRSAGDLSSRPSGTAVTRVDAQRSRRAQPPLTVALGGDPEQTPEGAAELAPPLRTFVIRPLPSPPVSANTPSGAFPPTLSSSSLPAGRAIRPLPAPPTARVRKLPTPPLTPARTTSSASSKAPSTTTSGSSLEFAAIEDALDTDFDDSEELGEVRAVTGHAVSATAAQQATRLAAQRHMAHGSWTPPPQDDWAQAENGRWHLNFHDKRLSLASTVAMSSTPLLLQVRNSPSPGPKATKAKPHSRVRVPHIGHWKKFSAS